MYGDGSNDSFWFVRVDCNAYGSVKFTTYSSVSCNGRSAAFNWKNFHVYIDDIIIWSKSIDDHTRDVRAVLEALRDAGLYLNPKSAAFIKQNWISSAIISQPGVLKPTDLKLTRF